MALRCKDKKDICILSTVHNAGGKDKAWKEVNKPNAVLDYNHTMGVVNLDQEMTSYPITW